MQRTDEPQVTICCSFDDIDKIAHSAERMRAALNLAPQDAAPIFDILEFQIAEVEHFKDFSFVIDFDANFDHCVLAMTRLNPPEIVVRESVYRHAAVGTASARVVLAHELGHLWLGHGQNLLGGTKSPVEEQALLVEWQADEFAAELLMPRQIILAMEPDCVARQFAVPLRSAQARLQTLTSRRRRSKKDVPRFEQYKGLLSRFENEVLKWVPVRHFESTYKKSAGLISTN
jgi:hypothetical protein